MATVVVVEHPEEEIPVLVTSLEGMHTLLHQYLSGEKAPGGVYTIKGFFTVRDAPAMAGAIEDLKIYAQTTAQGEAAVGNIVAMNKLFDHLVLTMSQVNELRTIATEDKLNMDAEAFLARRDLERSGKRTGRPVKITNKILRRLARESRARIIKARSINLKNLRAMSHKAYRRFSVGAQLKKKLLRFHRRLVKFVALLLQGKRSFEWLIGMLQRLNQEEIPDLFKSATMV